MNAHKLASNWKRSRKPLGEFVDCLDDRRIPYMSHSKLSLYEHCPRCYWKKYILRAGCPVRASMEEDRRDDARRSSAGSLRLLEV